jgi:hypothetical protein
MLLLYLNNNKPSCLSDIYYNKPLADIVEHCEFTFFTHLNPNPALIDTGEVLLLANIKRPWILNCAQRRVPIRHEGSDYAILEKTELCGCSLTADNTYIPAHSTGCGSELDSIKPRYVINSALAGIFRDMFRNTTLPDTAKTYHRSEIPKIHPPDITIKGFGESKDLLDEGTAVSTNMRK